MSQLSQRNTSQVDRRNFLGVAALAAGSLLSPVDAPGGTLETSASPVLRAQKLAWAGVRLQLESAALFIDPLTNTNAWGSALKDKLIPVDVSTGERYVLVTHRHPDHFDPATIRQALGDTGTLVCAQDVGALAVTAGFKVRIAALYEPILLNDFTVMSVPAVDGYGDPQVSWIVTGGGRRVIHCGDTLWHGSWWHVGRQFGPFDAAFLPINGALFGWRKPVSGVAGVMTPEQAVAAAVVLGARLVVPIHYGVVGAESYDEVADPEAALTLAARKRNVAIEIVRSGEWLTWQPRT